MRHHLLFTATTFLFACTEPNKKPATILTGEAIELNESGIIECINPNLRAQSPLLPWDLGTGFSTQDPSGWDTPEGLLLGGEGLAVGDITNDGLLDVFLPTTGKNLLFIQQENGDFNEESDTRLANVPEAFGIGATMADVDGDFDLDILVLNDLGKHQMLINEEGVFFDRASEMGLNFPQGGNAYDPGATWGDPNGDGLLDLFIAGLGAGPNKAPPYDGSNDFDPADANALWVNQGDSLFIAGDLPNHEPEPYSCCGAFIDLDEDRDQDLYIINDFGAYVQPNMVLKSTQNNGVFAFEKDLTSDLNIEAFGMGLAVGDLNEDGKPDFLVTDWGKNQLMVSDDSGWYEAGAALGINGHAEDQVIGWGAEFIDIDNDSRLDIWVGYGQLDIPEEAQAEFDAVGLRNPRWQPDAILLQDEDGQFTDVAPSWGIDRPDVTRGGVWADLNQDGFLDWIATNVNGPFEAYRSQCDNSAWLIVRLRQMDSNTHAIGAKVLVKHGERTQSRWMLSGGTSLSSGTPPELHFGLGNADLVDVEIEWADGQDTQLSNIESRQIITISRSD